MKIANLPTKLKLCETLENISQEISVSINLNSFSAGGKQIKWLTVFYRIAAPKNSQNSEEKTYRSTKLGKIAGFNLINVIRNAFEKLL